LASVHRKVDAADDLGLAEASLQRLQFKCMTHGDSLRLAPASISSCTCRQTRANRRRDAPTSPIPTTSSPPAPLQPLPLVLSRVLLMSKWSDASPPFILFLLCLLLFLR